MDKSPFAWMITPFQRALDFKGRSRRAEYWWFTLLWAALALLALALDAGVLGIDVVMTPFEGPAFLVALLALLLPHLAVSVRRLHDQNMSGWWYLVSLLPTIGTLMILWWMTRPGTAGDNRFGPDPVPPSNNPTIYYG